MDAMNIMNEDEIPAPEAAPPAESELAQEEINRQWEEDNGIAGVESPDAVAPAIHVPQAAPAVDKAAPSHPYYKKISSISKDSSAFVAHSLNVSLHFLALADFPPAEIANALRGVSEDQIKDRITRANSLLVLLSAYADYTQDIDLKLAVGDYAMKMHTIMHHLGLHHHTSTLEAAK